MIFHFSATGNSMYVARQIDENLKNIIVDLMMRKNRMSEATETDRAAHNEFLVRNDKKHALQVWQVIAAVADMWKFILTGRGNYHETNESIFMYCNDNDFARCLWK